jgi:predicted metalloendopeptidase
MINPKTKKINKNIKNNNKTIKNLNKNNCFQNDYTIVIADKNKIKKEENQIIKFTKNDEKTVINLQNDFFTYVNFYWIKQEKDNKVLDKIYFTQYDNFTIKQNEVYNKLIELIENYTKNNNNELSKEIKNLYNSKLNPNIQIFDKRLVESINYVDDFIANDDFYGLIAYINSSELSNIISPIKWKMLPNIYNPKKYISNITIPELPTYNTHVYLDEDDKKKLLNEYENNYLKKIFNKINKLLPTSKHIDINNILNIGDTISKITFESVSDNQNDNLIVTNEESKKLFGFDWELFAKKLGYKNIPKHFLVNNSKYLKLIMEQLKTNWKNWRSWWIYTSIKFNLNNSNKYYPFYSNYYRKFLEGRGKIIPEKIRTLFRVLLCFNNLSNNLYKENYNNLDNINYTNTTSNQLKKIFTIILQNNKWLTPKTKKYAILKIKKIKIYIDINKNLEKDPLLGYSNDDIWLNLEKIYNWRLNKYIENDGKDLINLIDIDYRDFSIYGKQSYLVNSFYIPTENEVYIPLGILQKPFINLNERGIIYNTSGIGYIIAHELSHSLDETGRKYGYDGKPYNWWNKKDDEILNRKFNNIKKQCKIFSSYDKVDIDVDEIVDESIADISALQICQEYLINYITIQHFLVPVQLPLLKEFYILFALNMRQLIAKKAYNFQKLNNPHLMDKYRVNITLSRLNLFKAIYKIKKGDKMYWDADTIW